MSKFASDDAHKQSVRLREQASALMMMHLKETHNHVAGDFDYGFGVSMTILTLTTHTRVH